MSCPKCKSDIKVKSGKAKDNQRYLCKKCGCNYTRSNTKGKSLIIKRLALKMYIEGLGFRSIGRALNVSHVSVFSWIRKLGELAYKFHLCGYRESKVKVIEIDELRTYIREKKTISGYGLLTIESGDNQYPLKLAVVPTGWAKSSTTD